MGLRGCCPLLSRPYFGTRPLPASSRLGPPALAGTLGPGDSWARGRRPTPPALAVPFTALACAAVVSSVLLQQTGDTALDPRRSAFEAFARPSEAPWQVRWHVASGSPASILGPGRELDGWSRDSLVEARRHADRVLEEHAELLGIGRSSFEVASAGRMGRTWAIQYTQSFAGLPVLGGRIDVRIHGHGRLVQLGSTAWPIAEGFEVVPGIDVTVASRAAVAAHAADVPVQVHGARLVIFGDTDAVERTLPRLAWELTLRPIDGQTTRAFGRSLVDAHSGEALAFFPGAHACAPELSAPTPTTLTLKAWTRLANDPVAPLVEVTVPNANVSIGGQVHRTDEHGQVTVDIAAPTIVQVVGFVGSHCARVVGTAQPSAATTLSPGVASDIVLGSASSPQDEAAHATAYHYVDRLNRAYRALLGDNPWLDQLDDLRVRVNSFSPCNAFYFDTGDLHFGPQSSTCNNAAFASIVAHEWGHALDDVYGGISAAEGVNEGWADIVAMYLLDDPEIGFDLAGTGQSLRSGTNTAAYGTGTATHTACLSWMGFAWKFRENLRATFGTPTAVRLSNDVVLTTIVANAYDQVSAVEQVFLADDDDGILTNGSPHRAQLVAACQAHGLPFPALTLGGIAHTPPAPRGYLHTPVEVEALAVPTGAPFVGVRVVWNDGQVQMRELLPTGASNAWHGLLPGLKFEGAVPYHFVARTASGATVRGPAASDYWHSVAPRARVYFEGFELGGAGITQGTLQFGGTLEWQIGAPAGLGGVGWVDPGTAATGVACAGTDLGLAGGDGAYEAGAWVVLRTPPIDCRNRTGLRLRFQRWLTVAPNDLAEVSIGSHVLWSSANAAITDSAWTTVDVPLSGAEGLRDVVVEFRLLANKVVESGGWQIDDVEVYSTATVVPTDLDLTVLPSHVRVGTAVHVVLAGGPNLPVLVLLGSEAGPTTALGLPLLHVGGVIQRMLGVTSDSGRYATTVPVPSSAPLMGTTYYWHALTAGPAGPWTSASNPSLILVIP